MANKAVSKITFDREQFLKVVKEKKLSIRKMGTIDEIGRNERTIRRYLNCEKMPTDVFEKITKYLKVDPAILFKGSAITKTDENGKPIAGRYEWEV